MQNFLTFLLIKLQHNSWYFNLIFSVSYNHGDKKSGGYFQRAYTNLKMVTTKKKLWLLDSSLKDLSFESYLKFHAQAV